MKRILLKSNIILLAVLFCHACSRPDQSDDNDCKISTDIFTMSFTECNCDSIRVIEQSENAGLLIMRKDTLSYRKGVIIDKLTEENYNVIYYPVKKMTQEDSLRFNNEDIIISSDRHYDLDDYRKQNVYYKEINGKEIKVIVPRKEEGITGIYVSTLSKEVKGDIYGDMSFNLYGKNLEPSNRECFIEAVKTIRFLQRNEENK